ncbi:hypothetical protein EJK80_06165 [Corynebacterium phoceense]|uniref:Uncharacterized protein n=1 Tax=Corynebacterium phoceense TaxID=1686286 RepID=A0A540R772_9CORY|nr:hypothetical protein [Corynebacterium phoceense]TQE43590.1 hypothetical protein EJK80_06165 [Corynebacterium phoceense]
MSLIILAPLAPIIAYIAAGLWVTRGESYEESRKREMWDVLEMNGDSPLAISLLSHAERMGQ